MVERPILLEIIGTQLLEVHHAANAVCRSAHGQNKAPVSIYFLSSQKFQPFVMSQRAPQVCYDHHRPSSQVLAPPSGLFRPEIYTVHPSARTLLTFFSLNVDLQGADIDLLILLLQHNKYAHAERVATSRTCSICFLTGVKGKREGGGRCLQAKRKLSTPARLRLFASSLHRFASDCVWWQIAQSLECSCWM